MEEHLKEVEFLARDNAKRLNAHDDIFRTVKKRQDDIEGIVVSVKAMVSEQAEMKTAMSVMKNEQSHVQEDVKEIKTDVKALVEKPGKRWDSVVMTIVGIVVGAVLGMLLKGVGL